MVQMSRSTIAACIMRKECDHKVQEADPRLHNEERTVTPPSSAWRLLFGAFLDHSERIDAYIFHE